MVKFPSAVLKVDQLEFNATWFDPYSSTVAAGLRFSLTAATQIIASFAKTSLGMTRYDILICKPRITQINTDYLISVNPCNPWLKSESHQRGRSEEHTSELQS